MFKMSSVFAFLYSVVESFLRHFSVISTFKYPLLGLETFAQTVSYFFPKDEVDTPLFPLFILDWYMNTRNTSIWLELQYMYRCTTCSSLVFLSPTNSAVHANKGFDLKFMQTK